jgi:hypothetical protein
MADVAITPQYRLVLNRWQAGTITIRQVELFVKTGWLTRDQADLIYTYPRKDTELVRNDPFTPEILERIKLDVNKQADTDG